MTPAKQAALNLEAARARLDHARVAANAADRARDDHFYDHSYEGTEADALLETFIAAEAERLRALLAYNRAKQAAHAAGVAP